MRRYLRYVLENVEPIRIADDSTSQSGQTTTLRYIPGTTIRGLVINALSGEKDFEEKKQALFSSGVRYLNAYISRDGRELFPSPRGFYEDKGEVNGKKQMENVVVNGDFREGMKRAALGRYAYIDGDTVRYYNVDTRSDLKIKRNVPEAEQSVFRNEYVTAGNRFVGYIAVEKPELEASVRRVFEGDILLGNARSAGFGKCRVVSAEYVDRLPYGELLPKSGQTGSCYLLLLSGLAMRDGNGELCGIDLPKLEAAMGVESLKVKYCSTQVADVRGYNRTWGIHTPSVVMYEQGSVFHLEYQGTLTVQKMEEIADAGIGIRRNEGFGRVLFLDQYEKVQWKEKGAESVEKRAASAAPRPEDAETLKLAARNYYRNLIQKGMRKYVLENPIGKGKLASSQLGRLEALTTVYQYDPAAGRKAIRQHFEHAGEKEEKRKTQKARGSIQGLRREVERILDTSLEELFCLGIGETVMGIPRKDLLTAEEEDRIRMNLLTELVRHDNKRSGQGE